MSASVLVAIYNLSSAYKQVLPFKEGDRFILLNGASNNPSWIFCVDVAGKIGYVPNTYVKEQPVCNDEFVFLIDNVLEKLQGESSSLTKQTRQVIKQLSELRATLTSDSPVKNKSNCDVNESGKDTENIPCGPNQIDQCTNQSPEHYLPIPTKKLELVNTDVLDSNFKYQNAESSKTVEEATNNIIIPAVETSSQTENTDNFSLIAPSWLIPTLIENVRHKTQLSHQNSKSAVNVVLNTFIEALPSMNSLWYQLKEDLRKNNVVEDDPEMVVYSEDKRKLLEIFKQLWYCKNDEQQRSWPVHEDEDHIASLLGELNNLLLDADPRITKDIIKNDDYEMVNLLVTYYQMEPRRVLRVKILHVFLTLCELDSVVITQLLNSVLPTELARDLWDNFEDQEKVQFSSYLLTVMFSTGETPPTVIYEFMNKKFFQFLFEKFEEVVKDGEEDLGDNLLRIILAFNLHFHNVEENLVISTLREYIVSAPILTEKLVFLVNREDDPVSFLNPESGGKNSVLKFMIDFFHFPVLVDYFYLNDIKVLLDIIVRQLMDLLSGEKNRLDYLCLSREIVKNSNYDQHLHQIESLKKCFNTVLSQEVPIEEEIILVREICDNFPCWFKTDLN